MHVPYDGLASSRGCTLVLCPMLFGIHSPLHPKDAGQADGWKDGRKVLFCHCVGFGGHFMRWVSNPMSCVPSDAQLW